jgi:hypothetical protein
MVVFSQARCLSDTAAYACAKASSATIRPSTHEGKKASDINHTGKLNFSQNQNQCPLKDYTVTSRNCKDAQKK